MKRQANSKNDLRAYNDTLNEISNEEKRLRLDNANFNIFDLNGIQTSQFSNLFPTDLMSLQLPNMIFNQLSQSNSYMQSNILNPFNIPLPISNILNCQLGNLQPNTFAEENHFQQPSLIKSMEQNNPRK